jgi:hypothetical protein
MALYKYVTIDTLKQILFGKIRFTQPSAFNDPFELLPEVHIPDSFATKNITMRFALTDKRRTTQIGELSSDFESNNCNDLFSRDIVKKFNESIGILCLSKNYDSLLMWAHYADKYTGAVIEFDESHEFFEGKIEVDYRNDRQKRDISAYLIAGEPIPISELCVKSLQWADEQEVRIVRCLLDCKKQEIESNGFPIYTMELPIECIKSVTLGERISAQHQIEIFQQIQHTHIALGLAQVSNHGYEFKRELIKFDRPISEANPVISARTAQMFFKSDNKMIAEMAKWMINDHPLYNFLNKKV